MRPSLAVMIALAAAVALGIALSRPRAAAPLTAAQEAQPHLPLVLPASATANSTALGPRPQPYVPPPPAPVPIPMTPAHAQLLSPPSAASGAAPDRLTPHELLEHEPKDTTWAWEAEQALRQVIASKNAAGDIEVAAIECRKTNCEIQAFLAPTVDWGDVVGTAAKAFPRLFSVSVMSSVPSKPRSTAIAYVYRAQG